MSSYVPRAEDAPRKLSHAEVALHFGADEYSHKSVEMPDRGRSNSYVVRDEQPGAVSSHAQVSAMHGADDYTLRQFHVPSQRQAQEALHRMRQRGAVAATAVNKVSLLFASAIIYCAYLAWFGVVEVARRKADGIPFVLGTDDVSGGGGGVSALWWHAVVWSAVVYGFFFGALALYARRCESAADAQSDAEQARTEIERTAFGKCLSLFSKAGLFAASYAWYEAIRLSLLVAAPTTSLWAWLAAAGVTMFFAALVAMLSAFERGLEEKLPSGAALTNKALSAEEKRGLVKLKVVWLMNDGIASSFAWIVALLIVSALQRSIQFQFWDADEPTKPMAPAVRRAAEWALFFLSAAFSALVLVAKEKALLSHGTDAFDDKEDGMPCAGCRSVLCQMEKKEGTGRQTKAMMKGAVIGVLLGAMAGAAVGNQGFDGIKGASIGAMVGAFGLSALGAGLGAVAYVVEQAEATNLVKKGPAALKMLGAGVAKLEKMAEGLREGVDRAIMSESVFDELANVMSLAQQLTEEATVWLCAITLFDAARGTFADPTTLADTAMAQYGRMLIFAVALTFLGAAAAYAMQLVLEQKAHELVHALGEDSSVKRRELYFATDLAEIVDNAIALLVGRTWNYAIVGALSYYNTLTDDSTPIVLYAVGATTAALFLNRRIARGLRTGCEEKLAKQPTLDRVEAMSPTESKRDVLTPMLRQLSDLFSVDADYDPELDDPPRSKVTALGALVGLGLGALIGAIIGDKHYGGAQGAVVGAMAGAVVLALVGAGSAAAIAVLLYPDAGEDESGDGTQGLSQDDGNAVQEAFEPIQSIVHASANAEV